MAIPYFEENLDIIGGLSDYPGSEDGLTAQEFKERFDVAGNLIKKFLNEVLIPQTNLSVDPDAIVDFVLQKALDSNGGTMNGDINMAGNKVTGLATPTADGDAANKKFVADTVATAVDKTLKRFTVNLNAANWAGDSAPYTQTVTVSGINASDEPVYGPVYSADIGTAQAEKEAYSCIDDLDTANGSVTFTCLDEKPASNVTVQMEVHRNG